MGLEVLKDRILERDPDLADLRRAVLRAEREARGAYPWREPEVRVGYGQRSRTAVPDPYTETREETFTRREQQTIDRETAGRIPERETRDIAETTARTTAREVVPGARSTVIREQTQESTQTDRIDRVGVRGTPEIEETRILERSRVTEDHLEERVSGFDATEGAEEISAEVRFYPPHPWEKRARTRLAEARVSGAQFALGAAERAVQREVEAQFVSLQLARHEVDLLHRRATLLARDAALQEELYEAGLGSLSDAADRKLDALDAERDRAALETSIHTVRDDLAARAGLDDPERIALDGPVEVPETEPAELDRGALIEVAIDLRREVGMLNALRESLKEELAAQRADRIPWFSLLSVSYDYQTRYGDKYRDEWRVEAGVEVPVFAWFRRESGLLEHELKGLDRDERNIEERTRIELQNGLDRLVERARAVERIEVELGTLRGRLDDSLRDLPETSLAARQQRLAIEDALLQVESRAFEERRDYALAVLAFEAVLGARLDDVQVARSVADGSAPPGMPTEGSQ